MKKLQPLLLICMLIVITALSACKANPKEVISRKWRPVDASGEYVTDDVKRNILKPGNMMEFTVNGDFTSYSEGEKPEAGAYTLSEDAKSINILSGVGRETQMKIRELNKRHLVLELENMVITLEPAK